MTDTITLARPAAPQPAPVLPDTADFNRDLILGDTGNDVAALQKMLAALGISVDEEERKKAEYGKSTMAAAELLAEKAQHDALLKPFFDFLCQYVLHVDPIEFGHPERSTGQHTLTRHYQSATGMQLAALEAAAPTYGDTPAERLVELTKRMSGMRGAEVGRYFADGRSEAWCADYAKHVLHATMPGVYDGEVNAGAISFKVAAQNHGAFRERGSNYVPKVGDTAVFSRTGGNHVQVVTKVENGEVYFSSGNWGNAVSDLHYSLKNPPSTLQGYTDTHKIAADKGIDIDRSAQASTAVKPPQQHAAEPRTQIAAR